MGRARNLSKLQPSASGLIETNDLVDGGITPVKMANAGAVSTVNIGTDQCSLYLSTAVANNNGIDGGSWTCNNEL